MEFDLTKIHESIEVASPELAATFSFLGSQIWNFVNMYNDLTQNNNFEVFSNYQTLLPSLLNLDSQLPELKKKQFLSSSHQVRSRIYQFAQLAIKVFVDSCLSDLEEYMHEFRTYFHKAVVSFETNK